MDFLKKGKKKKKKVKIEFSFLHSPSFIVYLTNDWVFKVFI